ncbi:serine/threonine phosphatase [Vacuolonema iberomarrocanum]|uniref:serine/threonine phosphatase n=1 Tax=Vacuolonema iberomarrocanum TaxID=3454632 RepID=UPI0019DE94BC|nr:serine/threonine phosphatase [filamentous cyanobacterium LEGE 07170]
MLVCPKCQFENPDDNRFCQKCGTSLTECACESCGAMVPFGTEFCPTCQAPFGDVWLAIVQATDGTVPKQVETDKAASSVKPSTVSSSSSLATRKDKDSVDPLCSEPGKGVTIDASAASTSSPAKEVSYGYLDRQQRYRLLDALSEEQVATTGASVRVLDCQPLRPSQLDLLAQTQDFGEPEEAGLPEFLQLPAIALDYLELEPPLSPALPMLQDAWEENGRTVLLLENRQFLLPLQHLWEKWEVEPFQAIHLFHQIADLWIELQPRGYAASVLQTENLKSDEDQLLYLQRLYADRAESPANLQALGVFWAQLIESQPKLAETIVLVQLCKDLQSETISTPNLLRSRLKSIAMELQEAPGTLDESIIEEEEEEEDTSPLSNEELGSDDTTADLRPPHLKLVTKQAQTRVPGADMALSNSPTMLDLVALEDEEDEDEMDLELDGDGDDVPTIVLPMNVVSVDDAGRTDVGRQREHNEDYFHIQTDIKKCESVSSRQVQVKGLYILCDGMGGHASGEVASEMAAKTLCQYVDEHWEEEELPSESTLRNAVFAANKAIFDQNQKNESSGSGRMGTTLVMLLIRDKQAAIAHVGDSRLYRYTRRMGLEQVTVDHEVGQREIHRGVEPAIAYARPDAYQLTQALGPRGEQFVNPDVQFLDFNEDALFLLCSDGLTDNNLLNRHCESHVEPLLSSQANLEQGVNALISLANEYNGHDNITVILVRVKLRPNLSQPKPQ